MDGLGAPLMADARSRDLTRHRHPLHALTGIRFMAAYYVVFFHSRFADLLQAHHMWLAGNFVRNGFLAVPLFFLLSGFILAYTYQGQIEKRGDHRRFWEARFARIWPVYVCSLFFSALPALVFPPAGQVAAAVLMVQAWNPLRPELAGTLNGMCWTLSVEGFFYLIFPWAQVWIERLAQRRQLLFLCAMVLLCVAIDSSDRTVSTLQHGLFAYIPLPLFHVPEFLTGVALGNYYLRRLATVGRTGSLALVEGPGLWTYGGAALAVVLLCRPLGGYWTALVILPFTAFLFGLAAERTVVSRLLSTKAMVLGGGISYSVYLMQLPIKLWILDLADHVHLHSEVLRSVLTLLALPLFAFVMFTLVENPARRVLRSGFARLEKRRGANRLVAV